MLLLLLLLPGLSLNATEISSSASLVLSRCSSIHPFFDRYSLIQKAVLVSIFLVSSDPDAREASVTSPFLEEQLLPQSPESPESPLLDHAMVPEKDKYVVEIVQVERIPGSAHEDSIGESSSGLNPFTEGHISTVATGEEVAINNQSSSRASPLGSVLDESGLSNQHAEREERTDLEPVVAQPSPQEQVSVERVVHPASSELSREVRTEGSALAQPPPGRTSPTGSALSESGGTSPFTSPRIRSHSDISRRFERMSPSNSIRSEPHFPLPPQQLESLLNRTGAWRISDAGPSTGDATARSRGSLPDTGSSVSSVLSHRVSPAGTFHAESLPSSRTQQLSEGRKHSGRQASPPLSAGTRDFSGGQNPVEILPFGSRGSYDNSRHSSPAGSTHTEPRISSGTQSPPTVPNSSEVPLVDSRQSLHDSRHSSCAESTHTGSRKSSGSHSPPTVPNSSEVPLVDSRQILHDSRHSSRAASTHTGSRKSSGSHSPVEVPNSTEVPLVDSRQILHDSRHSSRAESTPTGSRKSSGSHSPVDVPSRTAPSGRPLSGSSRSSRNESPASREVLSLLEVLYRKEQKAATPSDSVRSSRHQTSRGKSPPETLRQIGRDGALQSGPAKTSRGQSPVTSVDTHAGGPSERTPSTRAPFIPSRGTAFQAVNGERTPFAVTSFPEMEALRHERDSLVEELKIRTAHYERELRNVKTRNEDLEQQVLSVQASASCLIDW